MIFMSFIFSTIAYNKNLENQRNPTDRLAEKTEQEQKQKLDLALNNTISAKDLSKAQIGTLVFDIILITAITVFAALIIANNAHTIDLPNLGTMSNQTAYIMIGVSGGLLLTDLMTLCIHQSKHNARRQEAFKARLEGLQSRILSNEQTIKTAKKDVIKDLGGMGGMDNVDVVDTQRSLLSAEQDKVQRLESQLSRAQKETDELRAELRQQKKTLEDDIKGRNIKLGLLVAEKDKLERENQGSRPASDKQITQLEAEIAVQKEEIETHKATIETLQTKIGALELQEKEAHTQTKRAESLASTNQQLISQLSTKATEAEETQKQLAQLTTAEQALQKQLHEQSQKTGDVLLRLQDSQKKVAEQEEELKQLKTEMETLKSSNAQSKDLDVQEKAARLTQIENEIGNAQATLEGLKQTADKFRMNYAQEVTEKSDEVTAQEKKIETNKVTIANLQAEIAALEQQKKEATEQQLQAAADQLSQAVLIQSTRGTAPPPPPPMLPPVGKAPPPPPPMPAQLSNANRPARVVQERKDGEAPAPTGPPQKDALLKMKKDLANNNAPHFTEDAKKALKKMVTDPGKKEELIQFNTLLVDIRVYLTGKQDVNLSHSTLAVPFDGTNSITPVLKQYKLPQDLETYFLSLREFIFVGREEAPKGEKSATVRARAKACEKRILEEIAPLIDEEHKDKREEVATLENVLLTAFAGFRQDFVEPIHNGDDDEEWSD
jgi:hypothetical protein